MPKNVTISSEINKYIALVEGHGSGGIKNLTSLLDGVEMIDPTKY